jgi:hypothetical protein
MEVPWCRATFAEWSRNSSGISTFEVGLAMGDDDAE